MLRHENYIVKTTCNGTSRRVIWHADHKVPLDFPDGWTLEKTESSYRITDYSEENADLRRKRTYEIPFDKWKGNLQFSLPPATNHPERTLNVEVQRVHPPQAVYLTPPTEGTAHGAPQQIFMFYGQRYLMIKYQPVGREAVAKVGSSTDIFSYRWVKNGWEVRALRDGLKIKVPGGAKRVLKANETLLLANDQMFYQSTFIFGVHWWRFRGVLTENNLPPITKEEAAEDLEEKARFRKSIEVFAVLALVISIGMIVFSGPEKVKPVQTQVALKKPKIIPIPVPKKIAEIPKPTPKPTPKIEPKKEKKVVNLDKKKPVKKKKVAQKKKQLPKKVVAKKKPLPKKPVAVRPPPLPKKVVAKTRNATAPRSNNPPAIGRLAKTAKPSQLPPKPDKSAQLAKSLGFLSTSSKRPAGGVAAPTYDNPSKKYSNAPAVGGGSTKSNVLSSIAKGTATDSNIETQSARSISSNVNYDRKGLNDVQGRVSASEVSGGGSVGGSFGGGGLSVSGPGQVDDTDIEKALAKYLAKFRYCYEKALLSDPNLTGNIVLQWTISTAGKATSPKVVKSEMRNVGGLNDCLYGVLQKISFPQPKGGRVQVKKTFNFTSAAF